MNKNLLITKGLIFLGSVAIIVLLIAVPVRFRSSNKPAEPMIPVLQNEAELIKKDSLTMLIKSFCQSRNTQYKETIKGNEYNITIESVKAGELLLNVDMDKLLKQSSDLFKITKVKDRIEITLKLEGKGTYANVPLNILYMLLSQKNNHK